MSIPTTSATCLQCNMYEEDILEHTNAKCHYVHFSQTYGLLCNTSIYLSTLSNIPMTRH